MFVIYLAAFHYNRQLKALLRGPTSYGCVLYPIILLLVLVLLGNFGLITAVTTDLTGASIRHDRLSLNWPCYLILDHQHYTRLALYECNVATSFSLILCIRVPLPVLSLPALPPVARPSSGSSPSPPPSRPAPSTATSGQNNTMIFRFGPTHAGLLKG